MTREVYYAHEAAALLGMPVRSFYALRTRLEQRGMPGSLTPGKLRYDRHAFDAWRRGLVRQAPPANDVGAADWHRLLADAYGPKPR